MSKEYFMKHLPRNFNYSYETMASYPVSKEEYEICMAIPQSKKYLACITTLQLNTPFLVLYELNRYRKISGVLHFAQAHPSFHEIIRFSGETIFYGSIVESFFVVEDMLVHKGRQCQHMNFKEKMQNMILFVSLSRCFAPIPFTFTLPFMFSNTSEDMKIHKENVPYPIHSIQYHSLYSIKPVLNLKERVPMLNSKGERHTVVDTTTAAAEKRLTLAVPSPLRSFITQYSKPQYRKTAIFQVRPDVQFDIYYLYGYNNCPSGKNNRKIDGRSKNDRQFEHFLEHASHAEENKERYTFIDYAHIPDYTTSKLMNSIFRNIRENCNLDFIEESDDEDDFENVEDDKYVFLEKRVNMICTFHAKFKKWMPIERVDDHRKIVPISLL